ncbi:MAG: hypothetical protein INR65_14540 [Gluconacetobacter diazotrophicus]|nr:hypothetical protein [Gluconacetobacter diazotrophicus]
MFGSVVLDTAIGLALLFLFVSLICAAIREAIEAVLNERAAALERGVRLMLDDPDGTGLARTVLDHPLVRPLRPLPYRPERLRRPLLARNGDAKVMPVRARDALPAYVPACGFARALLDATVRDAGSPLTADGVRDAAKRLDPRGAGAVLLDAAERANGDLERLTAEVARWFDTAMARLSSWYRRRTRAMLFGIGFLLAAAMNVDAFAVGRALFADKALRDAAVAEAERDGKSLSALEGELDGIRFPTGWSRPLPQRLDRPGGGIAPGAVIRMLAGWVVTAFAVTLGAPFWFDLLGRFVAVRAAARPD